jgi:hypothetical protein
LRFGFANQRDGGAGGSAVGGHGPDRLRVVAQDHGDRLEEVVGGGEGIGRVAVNENVRDFDFEGVGKEVSKSLGLLTKRA